MKICTVDDCTKPHRARGLCGTHYNRRHQPSRHVKVYMPCAGCGALVVKERRDYSTRRPTCSLLCRHWITHGTPATCPVPYGHPSRYVARTEVIPAALLDRHCRWCGVDFQTCKASQVYCALRCKRKHARVRRRGIAAGSPVSYTWTEVVRVFLLFHRCCAYCEQPIAQQPEPDHVVPLSRGGSNGISNILPACQRCNSDKRELLLTEWNTDRARRGLPPRNVEWSPTDQRVAHLARAVRDTE